MTTTVPEVATVPEVLPAPPREHRGLLRRPKATTGFWSWWTTVDHKKIALLYGGFALVFFLVAGIEALLIRLERFGRLLRVARNRFFLPEMVGRLGAIAADLAQETEAGAFTAAEFNQRSGIGRNLTIEVLEFLDSLGVTQRVGELRHIVRSVGDVVG